MAVEISKPIPTVNYDGIADEMRIAGKRFVPWCGTWKAKKGKYDKKPCDVTGKLIKWSDCKTWMTAEDAYAAHMANSEKVSGIGFMTGYDEGTGLTYWLFDADHVIDGERINQCAQKILDDFSYGYREKSVGLDGYHIVFATEGKAEQYGSNPDGSAYELYNGGRFATVTGVEYQNGSKPFVAPMDAVRKLIDLAGLKPLCEDKSGDSEALNPSQDPVGEQGVWNVCEVESMLSTIPVKEASRQTWIKVGMALHAGGYSYRVWDEWNRTDSVRYDEEENRRQWNSFSTNRDGGVVGVGYLVKLACEHGWSPLSPPPIGPFFFKDGKLIKRAKGGRGGDIVITKTPPHILADIVDVETGKYRALVAMWIPNGCGEVIEKKLVVDRSELLDRNVHKLLTNHGGNFSSSNAKDTVEYLTLCDGADWAANRPRYESVSHFGWAREPLGDFMPYDADCDDSGLRVDLPSDRAHLVSAFSESRGSLEEWTAYVGCLRKKSAIIRVVLAGSFASVLLEVLRVQSFIVYVWGDSGSGKSVTIKIAASVWGNPAEDAGYYAKLSDTDVSTFKRAVVLRNLPLVLDEFESRRGDSMEAKRQSMQSLSYELSYGMEKNRGTKFSGFDQGGSWRLLTISAGETPITGDATQQGALNRILEINGEPFDERREARDAHHFVANQYGTAGREFIECLQGMDESELLFGYEKMRDAISNVLPDNPQVDFVTTLAFADALAERFVFGSGVEWNLDAAIEEGVVFAKSLSFYVRNASERDTDRKAIKYLSEWLMINESRFIKDECGNVVKEPYGKVRKRGGEREWCLMGTVLKDALENAGFSRDKTIRRMKREEILECNDGSVGFQKKVAFNGDTKKWCYVINERKLENYLLSA